MIVIGDEWAITADSHAYAVCKKVVHKKTGKIIYAPKTYHSSLEKALLALTRRLDRLSLVDEDLTLAEAIKKLDENHMKLKVLIEGAIPSVEVKLK